MDTWNQSQVRIVLRGTLKRLLKDPNTFKIKNEGKCSSFHAGDFTPGSPRIYLSIEKDLSRVYISLNDHAGSYSPNDWFWPFTNKVDREIKGYLRDIMSMADKMGTSPVQILHSCFPEAVDQEFEEQVLKPKQ